VFIVTLSSLHVWPVRKNPRVPGLNAYLIPLKRINFA